MLGNSEEPLQSIRIMSHCRCDGDGVGNRRDDDDSRVGSAAEGSCDPIVSMAEHDPRVVIRDARMGRREYENIQGRRPAQASSSLAHSCTVRRVYGIVLAVRDTFHTIGRVVRPRPHQGWLFLFGLALSLVGCIPSSDTPPVPTTAADLASLEVSAAPLAPPFSGDITSYAMTVGNGVTSTTVKATTVEPDATLQINNQPAQAGQTVGPIPLAVGQNIIPIVVTPKGSAPKSYTVTITRSANLNLSGLVFSAGPLVPAFAPDTVNYTVSAPNQPGQTSITATVQDAGSTITIGGAAVTSGQPFGPLPLNVGPNTFEIVVQAQGVTGEKKYTVVVTRAASNANLESLQVAPGAIAPAFDPAVTSYSVTGVGLFTPSVGVVATVQDPTATLTINGQAATSGQAVSVPVAIGTTQIPVVVRAQDTVTTKTYTITVTRP